MLSLSETITFFAIYFLAFIGISGAVKMGIVSAFEELKKKNIKKRSRFLDSLDKNADENKNGEEN